MAIWTCTSCGATERLNFVPDCCSICRGMMETQGGRTTLALGEDGTGVAYSEAVEGDESAIVALWQMGERLSSSMSMTLDDLLLVNRVAMLSAVYREKAA